MSKKVYGNIVQGLYEYFEIFIFVIHVLQTNLQYLSGHSFVAVQKLQVNLMTAGLMIIILTWIIKILRNTRKLSKPKKIDKSGL